MRATTLLLQLLLLTCTTQNAHGGSGDGDSDGYSEDELVFDDWSDGDGHSAAKVNDVASSHALPMQVAVTVAQKHTAPQAPLWAR